MIRLSSLVLYQKNEDEFYTEQGQSIKLSIHQVYEYMVHEGKGSMRI